MIGRRQLTGAAVLAALVLLLLPGSAAAAAWLDPDTRDPAGAQAAPDVTAYGDGNAAAIWTGSNGGVFVSERPRGGPWSAPQSIEPAGGVFTAPKIVALPDGELVAAWVVGSFPDDVHAARRPPGGKWSDPQPLSATRPILQDLVAGADGTAIALWTGLDAGSATATKPPGSATFEPPQDVPADESASLAVAPDGSAVVAQAGFSSLCTSFTDCVTASFRPAGGAWGPDELVTGTSENITGVAAAALQDSSFTVVWGQDQPAGRTQFPPGSVWSSDRARGGGQVWDAAEPVASFAADAAGCASSTPGCIDLSAAGDGTLVAIWQQGPQNQRIAASLRPPGSPWGPVETAGASDGGDAFPHAAFTRGGRVAVAWVAGGVAARAAYREPAGGWAAANLATPGRTVMLQDVVSDEEGNAATGFSGPGGVRTAGFDGAGPRFTSLSFPAGQTGSLPFSATAEDSWSGVSAIDWAFGDGGSATGGSVSHLYAPGTYTATATARDGAANASSRSGPVTVTAGPRSCGTGDRDRDGLNDLCDATDGSKAPIPLKTVAARVISGDVFIKLPAGARISGVPLGRPARGRTAQAVPVPPGFQRLEGAATIPVGSTLDTRRGRVELRASADIRRRSRTMRGQFSQGTFRLRQLRKPRGTARRRPSGLITELALSGSSFRSCGASTSQRSRRRVRRLFGDGKGTFRTRGRNAAATVRGTRWTVEDRCDGTLIRVRQGRVEVRDFVRGASFILRATRSYLARRRR